MICFYKLCSFALRKDLLGVDFLIFPGFSKSKRLLLEHDADQFAEALPDGFTALHYASQNGHSEVGRSMCEGSADQQTKGQKYGV